MNKNRLHRVQAVLTVLTVLAVLAVALPSTASAQARELSWPSITVDARLDAEGRLHVTERQVMRFTGDWNGGQRRFDLRHGQEFELARLTRLDSAGTPHAMSGGSLTSRDDFDWTDGSTLRWRSRLESDPPFDGTEITYVLEFTYSNILVPDSDSGNRFVLDHDFSFADREGPIDRFELRLSLDDAWRARSGFPGTWSEAGLPPGRGFVVTVPLEYLGEGRPAGVVFGAAAGTRIALAVVLWAAFVLLLGRLYLRERALGRFAPRPRRTEINPEWLQANVFHQLPEVVGAMWDDRTAAPEVAATLARLVQEKKLSSTVKSKQSWLASKNVLHLTLEVPRERLAEHELALVNALFQPHETTTDTDRVRERYKKSGFDPAFVIRKRLAQLIERTIPGGRGTKPSARLSLLLAVGAIALVAAGVASRLANLPVALALMGASLIPFGLAFALAHSWRLDLGGFLPSSLIFVVPLVAALGVFTALFLLSGRFRVSALLLAGVVLWLTMITNSVFNAASSRQSAERIALRKRFAAARDFFRAELAKERPELRDAWFPWMLAFGLGRHVDQWFRAFGAAGGATTMMAAGSSGARGGSSSGGSSWSGFGGGGGFSGAGSSASFAAAVGGMASSVPAPSSGGSSGGGGGGGGGGSSGGGGGGGW